MSLMFILSCIGFIIGGILSVWLSAKLGFGKVLVLGCTMQLIVYSIQAAAPPFPVFAIFNLLNGMGICLQDSLAHGFVGSLSTHRGTKLQVIQSFYGLGGLLAPFVSTQFANRERWSLHYLTCLGLVFLNLICQIAAFRFKNLDDALRDGERPPPWILSVRARRCCHHVWRVDRNIHHRGPTWGTVVRVHRVRILGWHSGQPNRPPSIQQMGRRTARPVPLHRPDARLRIHHLVRALPRRERRRSRLGRPRNGTHIPSHSQPSFSCPSPTHLRWGFGLDRRLWASGERCDSIHHWCHRSEPRDKELTPYGYCDDSRYDCFALDDTGQAGWC